MDRVLRVKLFLGSTTEAVEKQLSEWLKKESICIGNYTDLKLFKLGSVYQLVLVYAEVVQP
jgi:hypothetical protein